MPSSLFGPRAITPQGIMPAQTVNPQTPTSNFQPPANLGQIKGMMNMLQSAGNPQAMFQSLLMMNPQFQSVMQTIQQYNGDAKAAFYDQAKQKGVDPNTIINMLK